MSFLRELFNPKQIHEIPEYLEAFYDPEEDMELADLIAVTRSNIAVRSDQHPFIQNQISRTIEAAKERSVEEAALYLQRIIALSAQHRKLFAQMLDKDYAAAMSWEQICEEFQYEFFIAPPFPLQHKVTEFAVGDTEYMLANRTFDCKFNTFHTRRNGEKFVCNVLRGDRDPDDISITLGLLNETGIGDFVTMAMTEKRGLEIEHTRTVRLPNETGRRLQSVYMINQQ